ncbi:hypothetical protein QYF48_12265 [Brevibacillus agri]|uniref:hypothetical protein n=1 Tax=Brevibacillus agri TaxID=51101 RepID=UPI0025B635AE|nr:hypothetical protein [Brevibacillus agri]MDN4093590.1 hypothetical protein [Brevibacillus agri]
MKQSYWRDGLSVDETKFSVLIGLLILFSILAGYIVYQKGDVPDNLTNLLYGFIAAVAGINIAHAFKKKDKGVQHFEVDDSDMDTNHYYTTDYDNYEPQKQVNDNAPI